MKVCSNKHPIIRLLGFAFICSSLVISTQVVAAKELSFCPAGGPGGWLNHFNYKRDMNILSNYQRRHPGRPYPYLMQPPHSRYYPSYAWYFQRHTQHSYGPYGGYYRHQR